MIAERLRKLNAGRPAWAAIDAERAVPCVEAKTGLELAESQRQAFCLALRSKALVITGGPGVGKTTLVNSILKVCCGPRASRWRSALPPAERPSA